MKSRWLRHAYRPTLEGLEDRCLLAAPVINSLPTGFPVNIPIGKTLTIPITGVDPAGGSVSYSVTTDHADVTATQRTGTFLDITVAGFGDLQFQLFGDLTPQTVATIGSLVKQEFYNGLTFHRVVQNFVIQGGDPSGNGTGGPGFAFDDEFNSNSIFSGSGQLAMANAGKDTNGSQFFVTIGTQRALDFNHAIFGQLVKGFDVLNAIQSVPVDANSKPTTPVVISNARIVQDASDAVFTLKNTGTTAETAMVTVTATSSTGGTSTSQFQVNVVAESTDPSTSLPFNDPPILGPVSNAAAPAAAPFVFNLSSTDLENDAPVFEALVQSPASGVTATVSGTQVTVNPGSFTGPVKLLVGVKDTGATTRNEPNSSPFDTQLMTIAFGDQALTAGATQPPLSATEGTAASAVPVATFTDADLTAVPADYTVVINWGDGTGLDTTSGAVTGTAGSFTVTGTHTFKEAGTIPVKVTITDVHAGASDKGGALLTVTNTATIADATLTARGVAISAQAQTAFSGAVATLTDADPNAKASDYSAIINWGDNTSSAGVVSAVGGGFQVNGTHTYAAQGAFSVSTNVTDVNTAGDVAQSTANAQSTATVAAPPPVAPSSFLDRVYNKVLGRALDDSGRQSWGTLLAMGVPQAVVVYDIESTLEGRIHQVELLFQQYLGRVADMDALIASVNYLGAGGNIHELTAVILSSDEYFNRFGGGSNSGFVSAVYHSVLNRAVDPAAQSALQAQLAQGTSRVDIAREVMASGEAVTDALQAGFQRFIGRPANAAEIQETIQVVVQAAQALHIVKIEELETAFLMGNDQAFINNTI
jgi:cyclophilin family peptidyl-prolyl cis-trans isomerase